MIQPVEISVSLSTYMHSLLFLKGKSKLVKVKVCIAVNGNLTATECHLPYGIVRDLPPITQVNSPHLTPARQARTRFTYTLEGWKAELT